MARFIGTLKTIKIDYDQKCALTYDVQLNVNARKELNALIADMEEPLSIKIREPLNNETSGLFALIKSLRIDQDKAQILIEFIASEKDRIFWLINKQTDNLVFEFAREKQEEVKDAA